jgi:nucleolar protein 15
MRAYFSQFGPITRLRLSRNRLTGRSKHYAFIEFASTSVAKIVAESMDNYLMFGHILKCKFVPQDQLHPEVWKGANRRFNMTPWNKIEKRRLNSGKTREKWEKKIVAEQGKRDKKAEKLKAIGYEFKLPELKSVDQVPVQEKPAALEDAKKADDEVEAANTGEIEAADAEKATTGKSRKKSKKNKEVAKLADETSTPVKDPEANGTPKSDRKKRAAETDDTPKSKKAKKTTPKDDVATTPEKPSTKSKSEKKARKAKA